MSHEEFRPAPMTHYQQRAAPYPPSSSTRSPPSSFDARYRHLEAYLPAHVPSYPYASHSPSFYNAPADSLLPSPQAYCPPSASSTYLASPPPTPEAFSSSWSSPTSSYLSDFGGQTYAGSSGAGDWHQGGGSGEELTAPMGRFAAPGEGHIEEPYPQRSPKVMPYRAGVTVRSFSSLESGRGADLFFRKPFAAKLYWMLEHPADYGEIAKWAETGNAFLIATGSSSFPTINVESRSSRSPAENTTFVNQILPDLFTHRSITSFLRQLHLCASPPFLCFPAPR